MKIRDCKPNYRPREKAARSGVASLSDQELICLLLGSGTAASPVEQVADSLLQASGQLSCLSEMEIADLTRIPGIGQARALIIQAALELAGRALQARAIVPELLSIPDVVSWFQAEYGLKKQEHFVMICLDARNRILRHKVLFIGTLDQSLVHPREVFREAFASSAVSLLFVHNHPSGDPTPSPADLHTTEMLENAADLCGIHILDHLIVARGESFSFRAHGLLN